MCVMSSTVAHDVLYFLRVCEHVCIVLCTIWTNLERMPCSLARFL